MPGGDGQLAGTRAGHAVQFYGDDDELAASVGSYLGEGLAAGGTAVIVATEAHRLAFAAGLAVAGADAGAAGAAGRLVTADAAGMLAGFLAGGRLDRSRFHDAAGGLIGRVAAAGQPVRIYAEMVALLWDDGQVALALELEGLWNELASRLPFALLCGYPARLLAAGGSGSAVEQVCCLHTGVTAPYELPDVAGSSVNGHGAVRSFPFDGHSARAARQFVLRRLGPHVALATAVDAEIIAAELAANALVHARTSFTVAVWRSERGVRICVRDAAPLPPGAAPLPPAPGHGLHMIAQVADRWGVQPQVGGKIIWAELPSAPNTAEVRK